jgi:multidrug efflux pump subunit AcrA (membrane-fusion protein)
MGWLGRSDRECGMKVTDASASPSRRGDDLSKLRELWVARVSRWKMPAIMPCISTGTKVMSIAETVAAAERTARQQAERALAEAQATIHDLQTKLGYASLAQTELQAAARRDQDAIVAVQAELGATCERLAAADAARENLRQRLSAIEAAYAAEQSARQQAERARRDADAARTVAESRLRQMDLTAGEPVERTARRPDRPTKATNATTPAKPRDTARRGEVRPLAGVAEPEPVQWWLTSAKKTRRR